MFNQFRTQVENKNKRVRHKLLYRCGICNTTNHRYISKDAKENIDKTLNKKGGFLPRECVYTTPRFHY
jgi:hypothetical protein